MDLEVDEFDPYVRDLYGSRWGSIHPWDSHYDHYWIVDDEPYFLVSHFSKACYRFLRFVEQNKNACLCLPAPTGTIVSIDIDGLEIPCLDNMCFSISLLSSCSLLRVKEDLHNWFISN